MAIICSGVGATALGFCSSLETSGTLGTSPGVNVLAESFFASSSASLDANSFSASVLSYPHQTWKLKINSCNIDTQGMGT